MITVLAQNPSVSLPPADGEIGRDLRVFILGFINIL